MTEDVAVSGPEGAAKGRAAEIRRRRTFAIISHPDAGKTTLTEKLLLYGGAIHLAGSVKARRAARHATSDWMAVERERGISVSSSVLQFEYRGRYINLLDTPGHQDFSEDTYRALLAADSAVMLLDNRKGVEEQTRKLFDVCRMRRLPIFTFVNKCDRVGVEPLALLDGIEADLGIRCAPVTWPVFDGWDCVALLDRGTRLLHHFRRTADRGATKGPDEAVPLDSDEAAGIYPAAALDRAREEADLLDVAGAELSDDAIASEEVTPTFFGSALLNLGVDPFLRYFLDRAPPPATRRAGETVVRPEDDSFRGFVFKIQANMDPKHRDRIAFVRIVSGRYESGMRAENLRTGEDIGLGSARRFLAQDREHTEEAVAGDVIGIHDRGNLWIGDTLSTAGGPAFDDIPRFSPERFARLRSGDPLRRKHLDTGLRQLSEEGAVQVLFPEAGRDPRPMVGVVGPLQFEILLHRLENEYGVEARLEALSYRAARWAVGDEKEIRKLASAYDRAPAFDHRGHPMILFESEYSLRRAAEDAPGVGLHAVSP
ncbi:MAG: peptide chain release factor 3 [Gemmatimonadota bacterium]|nr:peptide chain release factor 3 [Gemmatimonadota bacterium]